nr:IS630 family transposase [Rhodococcus wratislaviensis]GLK37846.1 IS630 family transposase [Rhodococcus wratislaviensis]
MRKPVAALEMTAGQREVLESVARSQSGAHREVVRAKALLMAADGQANATIGRALSVSPGSVSNWRARFVEDGVARLGDVRKGRGRKASIPQETIEKIVDLTQNYRPEAETPWSCRTMAEAVGVSKDTVQRVWSARCLKPHRVDTATYPNDPRFGEKLVDVVGLYLNPSEQAIALCADQKSSLHALDHTHASPPTAKERRETITHDHQRHGTTTLFAALDVLTRMMIGHGLPRHRHRHRHRHRPQDFVKFLRTIDREVPNELTIHLILDNDATHKHPKTQAWLAKHPRFEVHSTPTSSSWLQLVEHWFRELTDTTLRRGVFHSVPDLIDSIQDYLDPHNDHPHAYVWTATADSILAKVARGREEIS